MLSYSKGGRTRAVMLPAGTVRPEHYEIGMVRRDDWTAVARWAALDPAATLARIEKLAEAVVPALVTAAADPAVRASRSKLPARLVEEVEANVARCRSALAGRPARSQPGSRPTARSSGHRDKAG